MKERKRFIGFDYLVKYTVNSFDEQKFLAKDINNQLLTKMIHHYIENRDRKIIESLNSIDAESQHTVNILDEILDMQDDPLPYTHDSHIFDELKPGSIRKKTRTWTNNEDKRLLAGIYRFGIENWTKVANFVGSGRTRSQCAQRWVRKLDPSICKDKWTLEEEEKLKIYVERYGVRSWTKIASLIGNRSDVQCRYHYQNVLCKWENNAQPIPLNVYPNITQSSGSFRPHFELYRPSQSSPNFFYSAPQPSCIIAPSTSYCPIQTTANVGPKPCHNIFIDQKQKEELDSFLKYFK